MAPPLAGSAPGVGDPATGLSAGGRDVCRITIWIWEASTPWSGPLDGIACGTGPWAFLVSWVTTVRSAPLMRIHCTRVTTRWAIHWSASLASVPTHPGVSSMAVTFIGLPRSRVMTWPSESRMHTHALVGSSLATFCAEPEPACGQGEDAWNGIGTS